MLVSRSPVLALFVLIAACTPRGTFTKAPVDLPISAEEVIYVGTSRSQDDDGFGFGRSETLSFMSYGISIPPDRGPGELSWPPRSRRPDTDRDFLTVEKRLFSTPDAFRSAISAERKATGQSVAVIYVHGFNVNMAEAVYRFAQMHYDLEVPAVPVTYSWPSRGSALGYIHDRDSALFARRGLQDLMEEVSASGMTEIVIVAHSLGASLSMETLRQLALEGDTRVLGSITGVVLLQPDIDVDVFRSQARDIGTLPQPFVIFGSSADRILNLSARVSGAPERLGNLSDISRIADLPVTYVDTKNFAAGSGHMNLATNPALISLFSGIENMDKAFAADDRARVGLLPGIVLTVRNATEIVLAPVVAIDEELYD